MTQQTNEDQDLNDFIQETQEATLSPGGLLCFPFNVKNVDGSLSHIIQPDVGLPCIKTKSDKNHVLCFALVFIV